MTPPAGPFTTRHRKALIEVLTAALTHEQLDELTAAHPVPGDPGHDAAKAGRVELIVLTLMDEPDQTGLLDAAAAIAAQEQVPEPVSRQWQMLTRRLTATGHHLPTPPTPAPDTEAAAPAPDQTPAPAAPAEGEPAPAPAPAPQAAATTKPAPTPDATGQQLVAVGGTADMLRQLQALEGIEVIHVQDQGTRAQALAVLSAVNTALQTPGAVIAVGGPSEMLARLALHG